MVRIHKFASTDAFVAIDLPDVAASSGPLRWARRVLQGGAKELARSQTYTYAALNMRHGGASAGISAPVPKRKEAIAKFVAEAAQLVKQGTYLPDAAKGVSETELAHLRADDPRDTARLGGAMNPGTSSFADSCEGLSAAVCADQCVGGVDGLNGRNVAIEGFAANGPALAAAVVERGAVVRAIATSVGCVRSKSGFEVQALSDAWDAQGAELVHELGLVEPHEKVFASGTDVVFVGSKMGVVNHQVAASMLDVKAVVACGRIPLTARALAVVRRAGVPAPADFVALAGSTIALWGSPTRTEAEILAEVTDTVRTLSQEFASHDEGPFMAACYSAESFLHTWQDLLPFGRPLAP